MWAYNLPSGSNNQNMSVNSLTLSNIASGAHFTPEQLAQVSFRPASPDAANLSFNAAQLGANANFNLQHGFQHGQGHSQVCPDHCTECVRSRRISFTGFYMCFLGP
jgi:hypothetical protein